MWTAKNAPTAHLAHPIVVNREGVSTRRLPRGSPGGSGRATSRLTSVRTEDGATARAPHALVTVAVQSGSPLKPVTVNAAGSASEAGALSGETLPLAQDRLTVTLAPLSGMKSLSTLKVVPAKPSGPAAPALFRG